MHQLKDAKSTWTPKTNYQKCQILYSTQFYNDWLSIRWRLVGVLSLHFFPLFSFSLFFPFFFFSPFIYYLILGICSRPSIMLPDFSLTHMYSTIPKSYDLSMPEYWRDMSVCLCIIPVIPDYVTLLVEPTLKMEHNVTDDYTFFSIVHNFCSLQYTMTRFCWGLLK